MVPTDGTIERFTNRSWRLLVLAGFTTSKFNLSFQSSISKRWQHDLTRTIKQLLVSIKRNTTGVNDRDGNDFKRYWYEMEKGVKKKERLNDRFFNRFWKHCQVYERKKKSVIAKQIFQWSWIQTNPLFLKFYYIYFIILFFSLFYYNNLL